MRQIQLGRVHSFFLFLTLGEISETNFSVFVGRVAIFYLRGKRAIVTHTWTSEMVAISAGRILESHRGGLIVIIGKIEIKLDFG